MSSPGERQAASQSPVPPAMSPLTPATAAEEGSGEGENGSHEPSFLPNSQNGKEKTKPAEAEAETEQIMEASLPVDAMNNLYEHEHEHEHAHSHSHTHAAGFNGTPPNMDMLLALTTMSAASSRTPLLESISPAQMALAGSSEAATDKQALGPSPMSAPAAASTAVIPLQSFARIEFADSEFQMTTYAVIIGRDQGALDQARRDAKNQEDWDRLAEEAAAAGLPLPPQKPQKPARYSRSWYSEEGGMLGPESDGDEGAKRRKPTTTDSGSRASAEEPQDEGADVISDRQYVSHTPGAAAVDLAALRPSPSYVPKISIHSPGPTSAEVAANTKSISRKHLRIGYDQERGVFEARALHKNGFFCRDVHYTDDFGGVVLRSGDHLQIKDVSFVFYINGVAEGKTGAEDYDDEAEARRYSEGGKEMSFEFESSHGREVPSTSEEEEEEEEGDEEEEEVEEAAEPVRPPTLMQTIEEDHVKPEPEAEVRPVLPTFPPKKRGPGRPPKNGIMSKREERLLKKQAAEAAALAQAKMAPQSTSDGSLVKRKVGRPRKHPLPEDSGPPAEKRRYKARKPKTAEDGSGADGDKVKRREKPKTPPLELDRANYTEEQLAKPNKNYGVLIDEVLTAAPEGLTLKQIYKRIQMKYPFYYFTVDTKGWESSVRHNLIGNDAFRKNGDTHLWSRVPGVDIDAGKKRKATPPDHGFAGPMHQVMQGQALQGQAVQGHGGLLAATHARGPLVAHPVQAVQAVQTFQDQGAALQSSPSVETTAQPSARQPAHSPALSTTPSLSLPAAVPTSAAPEPSVLPPDFVQFVTKFKDTVAAQIKDRTSAPEAIALSVVNRGLGLMRHTLAPIIILLPPGKERDEELRRVETIEKVVLGVFEASCAKHQSEQQVPTTSPPLPSGLVAAVHAFGAKWVKTLAPRLGLARGEAMIMSAVDRALGFVDHSVFQIEEARRPEYEAAECMLVRALRAELATLAPLAVGTSAVEGVGAADSPRPVALAPAAANAPRSVAPAPSPGLADEGGTGIAGISSVSTSATIAAAAAAAAARQAASSVASLPCTPAPTTQGP